MALIAVCAWCDRVRSPSNVWRDGDPPVRPTHGICPVCCTSLGAEFWSVVGWFYPTDGGPHGPVPAAEISELVEAGRLPRTAEVLQAWQSGERVEFLVVVAGQVGR